ncbi:hypothetical protein PF005_g19565 [Phytophthora fragariae]|nr:hypothetical protein PF003_g36841 [Phytophthora fragariae]KAE8940609.1 hypothetical protein PF009_g9580 [Phytophthora fragariae]KAE9112456.1 hypothetical protein PF007_g11091 [Phytophthora fragariae]KAE9119048.1 hypothetical protein PF010_g8001 [Phytophthora fragariae]KAE9143879.1 hypothetical protein PF006_g11119 [Phytophthora fragariae]
MCLEDLRWTVLCLSELIGVKLKKVPMMIDNKSTIARINNEKGSNAQKTGDVIYQSIKDAVRDNEVDIMYCPTTKMLADGFTKALGPTRFENLFSEIGLVQLDVTSSQELRGSVSVKDELTS